MKRTIFLIVLMILSANVCFAVTPDDWQSYVNHKIENENNYKKLQDKRNVYLYYEIYDNFCRKYGYKYSFGEYYTKIPAKTEVVKKSADLSYQKDYEDFYTNYSDYITHKKAPSFEYIQAKRALEQAHIELKTIPEKTETHYYQFLEVNASQQVEEREVNNVYMAKCSKVKPMPYSVVNAVSKYKTLKKEDVQMILEHLQARLNTDAIHITSDSFETSLGKEIMTKDEVQEIYFIYENQPENFRNFAPTLDKKYSQYYPKN